MADVDMPMDTSHDLLHFTEGALVYAGLHLHETSHQLHTHSFVEIAFVRGGTGTHHCLAGRRELRVGDVMLLRPGVWHGYEDCQWLELYNCCFSSELLHRELAWTREDPLLGYLLWSAPYSAPGRGVLALHLEQASLDRVATHLEALSELRFSSLDRYRGDVLGLLSLVLSELGRAAAAGGGDGTGGPDSPRAGRFHPAVRRAMRLLESDIARSWTLTALAEELHLAPAYLVRLFKDATGLPPKAYLAQLRAERAAVLLLHSDDPVTAIGRAVGWPDQNYFARRFKAHYGLSATTYRRQFATWAAEHPPGSSDPHPHPRPHALAETARLPGRGRRRCPGAVVTGRRIAPQAGDGGAVP
jgi:AraC family transcriptional regulator, L-rhamnose operon transcriptional activator RhaR